MSYEVKEMKIRVINNFKMSDRSPDCFKRSNDISKLAILFSKIRKCFYTVGSNILCKNKITVIIKLIVKKFLNFDTIELFLVYGIFWNFRSQNVTELGLCINT